MDVEVSFDGVETFYFNPEGKIIVAFAEWSPELLAYNLLEKYIRKIKRIQSLKKFFLKYDVVVIGA